MVEFHLISLSGGYLTFVQFYVICPYGVCFFNIGLNAATSVGGL